MQSYSSLKDQYRVELKALKQIHTRLSIFRLILIFVALISFYFFITSQEWMPLAIVVAASVSFVFILKWYQKKSSEIQLSQTLLDINDDEQNYIEHKKLPFENGAVYNEIAHPYTFDLDIFGEKSLFQHINRTATYAGKERLAASLQTILPNDIIKTNQEAIKELSGKLIWRQTILADAKIANDTEEVYKNVLRWSSEKAGSVPVFMRIVSFISPVILFVLLILSLFVDSGVYLKIAEGLFLAHLLIIGTQLKTIKHEIVEGDKIEAIIQQYSLIVNKIENEEFQSSCLLGLKEKLKQTNISASKELNTLSKLFARVQTIQNAVGSLLMNGFFLYHIHSLHALLKWKSIHAAQIKSWLAVVGEVEMLNSYANLYYNNPEFIFPDLNTNYTITLKDAGHPLIDQHKRICNNIGFHEGSFVILTGSNMSGKSTFLRTLGVNMVLAGTGAPICASAASIHPLPVIVSMRLSDSLSDSESYFFAEVKRLKQLMQTLGQQNCFILLDEILRGTNSDDKRSGTIGVIKKIVGKQGIGIIATHDLEVCNTTAEYPEQLSNKCFEVEIINDELVFDYKLREGICKNKSATFLMKKMGVI